MAGVDDEMSGSLSVTPKTTEQHLIPRSDKSVAYVTNNKRLRSTFCTIEVTVTTDMHEAACGLIATAEPSCYCLKNSACVTGPLRSQQRIYDTSLKCILVTETVIVRDGFQMRLMMEFTGENRGFCFVTYTTRTDAGRAVREANGLEIRQGRPLGVTLSVDNNRLFIGGLPRQRRRDEILAEMQRLVDGVRDVIVYSDVRDKSRNRGFAFVEFESHRDAAMARRRLIACGVQLWGLPLAIDWAEPEPELDDDTMSKVRFSYAACFLSVKILQFSSHCLGGLRCCRAMRGISSAYVVMRRLSVCPSRSWIMSKRIKISSKFFHPRVATPF